MKVRKRMPGPTLAVIAVAVILTPVFGGRLSGQSPKPAFDVAAVHEWGPGQGPSGTFMAGVQFSPGRVHSQCASLQALVFYAYGLNGGERLEGLPKWGNASCGSPDSAEAFTIDATMPASTTTAQAREMMQTLLAERFQFAAHWETRELPVFELQTIAGRSKLRQSDPNQDAPTAPHSIGCPGDDPHCHIGFCCGSISLTNLAGLLTHSVGRPVIDKTGLQGTFYFGVMKWTGDDSSGSSLPSLPSLLRDEYGLELKAERGPVRVLVIDHVEKPTAN